MNLKKLPIYSCLIVFCVLISSCTSSSKNSEIQNSAQNSKLSSKLSSQILLKQQYPEFRDKWSNQYLNQLNRSITQLLNLNNLKCKNKSRVVLTRSKALVANTINQDIYLSTAMIGLLRDEAELVFILAHENAHISLCHLNQNIKQADTTQLELAADKLALQLFAQLYYPSSTPLLLLNRLYRSIELDPFNQTHPGLEQRIHSLRATPPERYFSRKLNNRKFNYLKSRLN